MPQEDITDFMKENKKERFVFKEILVGTGLSRSSLYRLLREMKNNGEIGFSYDTKERRDVYWLKQ